MENCNVIRLSCEEVGKVIRNSNPGSHTDFLKSAHSLWFRFKNYDKNPPFALVVNSEIVSLIFSTFNRDGYVNLLQNNLTAYRLKFEDALLCVKFYFNLEEQNEHCN